MKPKRNKIVDAFFKIYPKKDKYGKILAEMFEKADKLYLKDNIG